MSRRRVLVLAAVLAVGLVYTLWAGRPLWADLVLTAVVGLVVALTWAGPAAPPFVAITAGAYFVAWCTAAAFAADGLAAWRSVAGLVAYGLVFVLAGNLLAAGYSRAEVYRALVVVAHVPLVALVATWLIDGAPMVGYRFRFDNSNIYALYSMVLMPALAVGELRPLVVGELVYVAWYSASRAGAAGLAAGLVALAPAGLSPRARGGLAVVLVAVVVAVVLRADLLLDNTRLEMWATAGRMWAGSPLIGQGPNSYKAWWMAGGGGVRPMHFGHAHSLPLNMLAEVGAVGLAAGAGLVVAVVVALVGPARRGDRWALSALAATVALLVHSLADVPTTAPYIAVCWLVLVRLGLAAGPVIISPEMAVGSTDERGSDAPIL